jgi:putative heme iron utilization protein
MTEVSEACRALARPGSAALATMGSGEVAGSPYASLVLVAWDAHLRPILLLSSLAEHTKNIDVDARASLLVTGEGAEPLAAPRMTLVGRCAALEGDEASAARAIFVASHPSAAGYASFRDFRLYRLEIEKIRLVAGFGRQAWVSPSDFLKA